MNYFGIVAIRYLCQKAVKESWPFSTEKVPSAVTLLMICVSVYMCVGVQAAGIWAGPLASCGWAQIAPPAATEFCGC